jgi:hypothetical protein
VLRGFLSTTVVVLELEDQSTLDKYRLPMGQTLPLKN